MFKSKEALLKDLGVGAVYNPHGGIVPDTKDVTLIELLIDLRDILEKAMQGPDSPFDDIINSRQDDFKVV